MIRHYTAYGFHIESELEICVLPESDHSSPPDLFIVNGDLSSYGDKNRSAPNEVFLFNKSLGRFLISGGNRIIIDRFENVTDDEIYILFLDGFFNTIAQQRGLFSIHASAICKNGKAVLICGSSGAGKSTLASVFLKNGWSFMADSISTIEWKLGRFIVRSAYPCQKLWEDSLDYFGSAEGSVPLPSDSLKGKYYKPLLNRYYEGTLPISMIVFLEKSGNDSPIIGKAGLIDSLRFLKRNALGYAKSGKVKKIFLLTKMAFITLFTRTVKVKRTGHFEDSKLIYGELEKLC